ncbi:MAG: ComEC/Rec2 family competence protein [Candidatus Moranbacteria bacterium]|nr:ComEC/Rec2 family competence protein [Candidatus Moranbacteria bacterium]
MQLTFKKFLLGLAVILSVILFSQEISSAKNKNSSPLEVFFLNIGQGDAILIDYLSKYQILIDGGPNGKNLLNELGQVMPWGDKRIKLIILTHPDSDHLSGLIDVLDNYEAGVFIDNGQKADTDVYSQLETKIRQKGIKKEAAFEGSTFSFGQWLDFSVFNPDISTDNLSEKNDNSLVLRMDFGKNSFLFTGDAEFGSEKDMIYDEENLDVDWLKVGHHGSKSSTSNEFLETTSPKYAVISVGKNNRYKHPSEETLKRLSDKNIKIFRTDEVGTIKVKCDKPDFSCVVE